MSNIMSLGVEGCVKIMELAMLYFCIAHNITCTIANLTPVVLTNLMCEYWIEIVVMKLPCMMITFPTRIICRRVSGFVNSSACSVWWRVLTTCRLHVQTLISKDIIIALVCKFSIAESSFRYFILAELYMESRWIFFQRKLLIYFMFNWLI